MAKDFFIDLDAGAFVQSFTDPTVIEPSALFNGDVGAANLYFLRETNVFGAPYRYETLDSGADITFAVGEFNQAVTGGSFTLSNDGNETVSLDWNASASVLEDEINGESLFDSTVSVTKHEHSWIVTCGAVGAETLMTGNGDLLTPQASVFVTRRVLGTATTAEVQVVRLIAKPAVYQPTWTPLTSAATATITVPVQGSATANEIQRINWSTQPQSGSYAITLPQDTRTQSGAVVGGVFAFTANHGACINQPVSFSDYTAEANFAESTTYYVAAIPSPTTLTIKASPTGTAITNATADSASGTMTLLAQTTDQIPATATASAIQTALELMPSIGVGNVSVIQDSITQYTIAFRAAKGLANLPAITVASSAVGAIGWTGTLSLANDAVYTLLGNNNEVEVTAEVQIIDGTSTITAAQSACVIKRDLIP